MGQHTGSRPAPIENENKKENAVRKAIDLFVNPNFATENRQNPLTQDVNEFYFKRGDDFFQDCTIDGLLGEMDGLGVEHAVLTIDPDQTATAGSRVFPAASRPFQPVPAR